MKIHQQKHRLHVTDSDLSGSVYDDVNLSGSSYENVNMSGGTYHNVNLSGCTFDDLNMSGWRVHHVNLSGLKVAQGESRWSVDRQQPARRHDHRRNRGDRAHGGVEGEERGMTWQNRNEQ
jgi:hypothetical protein